MDIFFIYTGNELPPFPVAREKIAVVLNKLIHGINETQQKA